MSMLSRIRNAPVMSWLALCHWVYCGIILIKYPHLGFTVYFTLVVLSQTERLLRALQGPDEVPLIPHPWLPFLGHVLGMFWYGASYFARVNEKTNAPIFALQTLNTRTIVVTSPHLAAPIQRASKNTSFYGMILEVTRRLVDFDAKSMDIIKWNIDNEHGHDEGLMNEAQHMIASMLSPGPTLNQLATIQLDKFSEILNNLVPGSKSIELSLMDFVKQTFTTANASTIYGPQNPFAMYPELVQAFWDYERGMIAVMADICPWITAGKPWKARKAINDALQEFIEKGYYRNASPLIQKRVAINLKHGLTPKMAGRAELILLFGIIGNAVPSTFWFLANVFARPDLLALIREESSKAVHCSLNATTGKKEKVISVEVLKTRCPLLVSTYRESLRLIANLASVRLVTNTHTISAPSFSPILLRKGDMIQIASGVIHVSEPVWGHDAKTFNASRFISETTTSEQFSTETGSHVSAEQTATKLPKNVPSAAYRAFGGGSVICPGRHFAQTEIIGFVAMCVHMLDIVDTKSGGTMPLPERDNRRIPLSVMKPKVEPQVKIRRRPGEDDVVWRLEL
ncbi:cytochrome P450 [Lophiotrema nucula]|uniref:Cytochrome P450 n=1 Tax=Lophiotrema nucula TaxID=690887 RepID=A0A6A5ZNT5_9PLEO|nr:cytochrome P450 [Lophiotrema nucula]